MAVWIMAGVTFREAARKKMLWMALIAGAGFLTLFAVGLHFQARDFARNDMSPVLKREISFTMLTMALYAVDLLAVQPDVDRNRLGAIGHSLGAKEVLYLAAFDTRVRAAVSSEGGIGMSYSNWDAPWYLGDAIRRKGFDLDHGQVLALAAPRAFLLIGGDSADGAASWPYVAAVRPVWSLTGGPEAVGLFNHHQGHALPGSARDRAYVWLDWFLRPI